MSLQSDGEIKEDQQPKKQGDSIPEDEGSTLT